MSYPDPKNPFSSPAVAPEMPPVGVAGYPTGIEYLRSYQYIFENPNWMMNVLAGFLCFLVAGSVPVVGIVGQLVFLGYQYELIQVLIVTGGTRYPDFDSNRLLDYLGRSLWPFLVGLVTTLPAVVVFYIGFFGVLALAVTGAAVGGEEVGAVLAVLLGGLGMVVLVAVYAAFIVVITPMVLRAGLQQDFAAAFDFGWVLDFAKKMWLETLLTGLFVWATGMLLIVAGMLVFCIGTYAAVAVMMLAHSQLCYQLYMVYLGRGGKPIPMKPLTPMTPPQPLSHPAGGHY